MILNVWSEEKGCLSPHSHSSSLSPSLSSSPTSLHPRPQAARVQPCSNAGFWPQQTSREKASLHRDRQALTHQKGRFGDSAHNARLIRGAGGAGAGASQQGQAQERHSCHDAPAAVASGLAGHLHSAYICVCPAPTRFFREAEFFWLQGSNSFLPRTSDLLWGQSWPYDQAAPPSAHPSSRTRTLLLYTSFNLCPLHP